MRKALIVGIDHYDHISSLHGAVSDAYSVKSVLERNADGTLNFAQPRLMTGTGPGAAVSLNRAERSRRGAVPGMTPTSRSSISRGTATSTGPGASSAGATAPPGTTDSRCMT